MISVIICTHNPREDFLRRTLAALRVQTLPTAQWELLLIDNASQKNLAEIWDLSWQPNARHIRENELGLTPARLRGIREAQGELLVFVDDDNLLAENYLAAAAELFSKRADLGVASGRILPEYETPPPDWFLPHESWIAVRRIEQSRWANFFDPRAEPCGAGMCLRKPIALGYAQKALDARQRILGRKGDSLLSGEDIAITKVALGLGFSMGQFAELQLTHIIPARRVSEEYLFSLYRSILASGQVMSWLENENVAPLARPNWRVYLKSALRWLKGGRVERRFVTEEFRALSLARKITADAASENISPNSRVPLKPATEP
jgi:hypothetical protein